MSFRVRSSRVRMLAAAVGFVLAGAACSGGDGGEGSRFVRGVVGGLDALSAPTALAWGPDDRLYVAQQDGRIIAVSLDAAHTATEVEEIASSDDFSTVLGLTFGPAPNGIALYVSHNYILGDSNGDAFPNEIVRLSGSGWSEREVVVSGLPVSRHNHGTNAIHFDDAGRLFIAQGGTTAAGVPAEPGHPRFDDWDETPLSSALLVADLSAPGFDGRMVYDRPEASSETNLVSGDVRPFATGLRNMYDFVFHSNGNIYGIDNGNSEAIPVSLDCDEAGPMTDDPDQLTLIEEGSFYGSPNRNRGRTDPAQCSYRDPKTETAEMGTLRLLPSSSNGIIEFEGGFFGGEWDGDLLFAWYTNGQIRRVVLSDDGRSVLDEKVVVDDLNLPLSMVQASNGTIYIGDHGASTIVFLEPGP